MNNGDIRTALEFVFRSIDTENELLIRDAIERLMEGRTAIVIAPRLSTISIDGDCAMPI